MKSFITSLLLMCSVAIFAQKDFQGKATYQMKTKLDISRIENNTKMSPERKKMFIDMMKKRSNRTFTLDFNKAESIYKEEEKLSAPRRGGRMSMRFSGGGRVVYKNVTNKTFLTATEFFGKKFLITKEVEMPAWEMGSETKQIGNYTCYKATLMKKNPPMRRGFFRNEKDKKRLDSIARTRPKEYLVTAWYTPQIPVSNGPGDYWGLPGLILEVNYKETTILCAEVVLNPKEKIEIKEPTKGDKVTKEEYDKIMEEKMKEMRERFGGRRGGRGFH